MSEHEERTDVSGNRHRAQTHRFHGGEDTGRSEAANPWKYLLLNDFEVLTTHGGGGIDLRIPAFLSAVRLFLPVPDVRMKFGFVLREVDMLSQ